MLELNREDFNFKLTEEQQSLLVTDDVEMTTEQKDTVVTLFESAVNTSISTYIEKANSQIETLVNDEVKLQHENLRLKMKDYLAFVVESWANENAEAIKATMQAKLDSQCVEKIKAAFTESYVQVPDDKKDVLSDLTEEVTKAESDRDKMFEEARIAKKELFDLKKANVISDLTSEMTDTQKESIQLTLEHVQASDIEDFTKQAGLVIKAKAVKEESVKPEDKEVSKDAKVISESKDDESDNANNNLSRFGL